MAQPVGRASEIFCIHAGVTSIGHQQPPSAASTFDDSTPIPTAWPSLRAALPSSSPSDALSPA
jgi:hypothetical protein